MVNKITLVQHGRRTPNLSSTPPRDPTENQRVTLDSHFSSLFFSIVNKSYWINLHNRSQICFPLSPLPLISLPNHWLSRNKRASYFLSLLPSLPIRSSSITASMIFKYADQIAAGFSTHPWLPIALKINPYFLLQSIKSMDLVSTFPAPHHPPLGSGARLPGLIAIRGVPDALPSKPAPALCTAHCFP